MGQSLRRALPGPNLLDFDEDFEDNGYNRNWETQMSCMTNANSFNFLNYNEDEEDEGQLDNFPDLSK